MDQTNIGLGIAYSEVNRLLKEGEPPRRWVIRDLLPKESILLVTGEEGKGKTLFVEQLCRQLLRGEPVFDSFEPGDHVPQRILFLDTEMTRAEAVARQADFEKRDLKTPEGSFFKAWPGGLTLDEENDERLEVEHLIRKEGIDFLWIDAASNAVTDPLADRSVRGLFNWLQQLFGEHGIQAAGITHHNRKQSGDRAGYKRQFDDLFGSREWKGRSGTVLNLENSVLSVFKDRAGALTRRFPTTGRVLTLDLQRPGLEDDSVPPFIVRKRDDAREAMAREKALTGKIEKVLGHNPDFYTKTSLAAAVGGRTEGTKKLITELQRRGVIVPMEERAKLRLAMGWEKKVA